MRTYSAKINVFVRDAETGRQKKSKSMSSLCFVLRDEYKYRFIFPDNVRIFCLYCKDIHTKDIKFTHKKPKTLCSNVLFGIQSLVHVRQVSIKNNNLILFRIFIFLDPKDFCDI
jgi:hypothetical protein